MKKYVMSDVFSIVGERKDLVQYHGERAAHGVVDGEIFSDILSHVADVAIGRSYSDWQFGGKPYADSNLKNFLTFISNTDFDFANFLTSISKNRLNVLISDILGNKVLSAKYFEFKVKEFLRSQVPDASIEECFKQFLTILNDSGSAAMTMDTELGNLFFNLVQLLFSGFMPSVQAQNYACYFEGQQLIIENKYTISWLDQNEINTSSSLSDLPPILEATAKVYWDIDAEGKLIFNNSSSIALRKLQKSDKKCDALIGFLDKEVSKIEFERVLMRFWEVDKTISQNIEKEGTLEFLPLLETAIKQLLIHFADFSKKETTDDDRTLVHKVFVEKLDRMLDYYDRIKKDANYPQYPCVLEARGILAEGTPAYLRTMVLA